MKHSFDYLGITQFNGSVDVSDIGNVCLCLSNSIGLEWYIKIWTKYGKTRVKSFGPLFIDFNEFTKYSFSYNYQEFEYNESRIIKYIDKFINDQKKMITDIQIIDEDKVKQRLEDIYYANHIEDYD